MSTPPPPTAMDVPRHNAHPASSPAPFISPPNTITPHTIHVQGIASETAKLDTTTEIATPTVAKKRGFFQRAVDSFKPPLGQKGWVPDRIPRGKRAYVDHVPDDPEKGTGTVAGGTHVDVNKQGDLTGVLDDNGGLKRALHGRHLQVNFRSCTFWIK